MSEEMAVATAFVFRTRPRGDFLVQPCRPVIGSRYGLSASHTIALPREEYRARIVALMKEALQQAAIPMARDEADRTPDPPMQAYAASVSLAPSGSLILRTLRRLHGGHAGTGDRYSLPAAHDERLPEALLVAMEEREEDIPKLFAKWDKQKERAGEDRASSSRRRTKR